jgi:hypothetical protein
MAAKDMLYWQRRLRQCLTASERVDDPGRPQILTGPAGAQPTSTITKTSV